jgi:hypothetical protein
VVPDCKEFPSRPVKLAFGRTANRAAPYAEVSAPANELRLVQAALIIVQVTLDPAAGYLTKTRTGVTQTIVHTLRRSSPRRSARPRSRTATPSIPSPRKRLHDNALAIALAKKLARIAWSVLARE